jgi:hypothetical protein
VAVETVEVTTVPTFRSLPGLLEAFMGGHKLREFAGWRIEQLARSECGVQVQLNLCSCLFCGSSQVWYGCLVEHPYHAFGRGLLKAEDDAG